MKETIKGAPLSYRLEGITVLTAIAGFLWLSTSANVFVYSMLLGTMIFAIGTIAGVACGYFFEQRELRMIKEKGERKLTIVTWLLVIGGLMVIFALLWVFSPQINLYTPQSRVITRVLYVFSAPFLPAFAGTRVYVIKKWQSKNQTEILCDSGYFTARIYASPIQTRPVINL